MDDTQVTTIDNEFEKPVSVSVRGNMAIESARESQSILGMIMAAKHFPRDKFSCMKAIIDTCQRYALAESAEYAFPRGGQTVRGASIRLAEAVAGLWGNIDYGIVELERREGESTMQSYAWDLETNVRVRRNFTVAHVRNTRNGTHKLTDERDIYELTANQGARRLRACILEIIPGDVTEKAVEQCRKTLVAGKGKKTKEERILGLIQSFDKFGVPQEAIEKYLGHKMDNCTDEDIANLISIGNSLKDGITKRDAWFDIGLSQTDEAKALEDKYTKGAQDSERKAK